MKFLSFVSILFFSVMTLAGAPPRPHLDIKRYVFKIALHDSTDHINGEASVTFSLTKPASYVELDLRGVSAGKGMKVSEIRFENASLSFTHSGNILRIDAGAGFEAGKDYTIGIIYAGIPADGLIIAKNKFGDRTFFGDNWPDRAQHWLPVSDHPSDKASVDWIVTAPLHYEVIGNGIKVEESLVGQNRKLTHWREDVPIATKVMVIGAARFAIRYHNDTTGVSVESWVYPQNRTEGFHDYAAASPILAYFIKNIGPYSYKKLANVQSKTRYGGMENASNIFYFENSVTGKAAHDDLIAHEVAHQWFGNSATEADWHHVWLSEGFATYCTQLYNESTYGTARRAADMAKQRQSVTDFNRGKSLPVVFQTLPENLLEILSTNSYQKGSWILHMLRTEIGDEPFWKGLRTYYRQYQRGNATTEDFQKIMESASAQNLEKFFHQWLYEPGHPVIRGTWRHNAKAGEIEVMLEQQQAVVFDFSLEIGVRTKTGITVEKVRVSEKKANFRLKTAEKPLELVIDPNVNLLFEGTLNN